MRDRSATINLRGRVGETVTLRAYLVLTNGSLATPSNVSAVSIRVVKQGGTVTYPATGQTVATVILSPAVTSDPNYQSDSNDSRTERGYNFRWVAPGSAFPSAGWYTVHVTVTATDASITVLTFEGAIRGSV